MAKFIDFLSSGGGLILVGLAIALGVGTTLYIGKTVKEDYDAEEKSNENYSMDAIQPTNPLGGTKRRRKYKSKSRRRR
jgi:hypothetical protein